jgi:hypothetical protein
MVISLVLQACWIVGLSGCRQDRQERDGRKAQDEPPAKLTVQSPAFSEGQVIPSRYTADGQDVSPALTWSGLPAGAKELALVVDDPDAPGSQPWVHWVIYKIPADATGLPEAVGALSTLASPAGALQGRNSWDTVGYRGPAPPKGDGLHHYRFRLYVLGSCLELKAGLDRQQLLEAMSGQVVATGVLVGTYQR